MRFAYFSLALTSALIAGGCQTSVPASIVTGSVSLDGQPVKEGMIDFFPHDGKGASVGSKIKDGKYTIELTSGPKRVEIRAPMKEGETTDGPVIPIMKEQIPDRYNVNSSLTTYIKDGDATLDWDLTTQPQAEAKATTE